MTGQSLLDVLLRSLVKPRCLRHSETRTTLALIACLHTVKQFFDKKWSDSYVHIVDGTCRPIIKNYAQISAPPPVLLDFYINRNPPARHIGPGNCRCSSAFAAPSSRHSFSHPSFVTTHQHAGGLHGGVCDLSFPAHALLPVHQQWQHAGRIRFLLWTMISAAANDSPAPSAGEHTGMKGHKIRRAETGNSGFGVDIRRVKRSLGESNSPDI